MTSFMWMLLIYLPPHSSDFFPFLISPVIWKLPSSEEGISLSHLNCYCHDISQHHQLCLSGLSARMTLKTNSFRGLRGLHSQHVWGSHRFPKRPCLFTRPRVAVPAYCQSPAWSPLIVLICPSRLSICQSTSPSKPSRRCFSIQGK